MLLAAYNQSEERNSEVVITSHDDSIEVQDRSTAGDDTGADLLSNSTNNIDNAL